MTERAGGRMSDTRIVNLADLALRDVGNGRDIAARVAQVGPLIGSTGLGCSLVVVPPGKSSCPFHRHHVSHEMFFVLEGQGETRLGSRRLAIRPGDLIAAPAGAEAHQIVNTGASDLRYLAMSTEGAIDIIEYPDSGKIMVDVCHVPGRDGPPNLGLLGRIAPTGYYDDDPAA